LRKVLVGAVEEGTGSAAALGPFAVAGKTGTARIAEAGRYRAGAYIASFAGYFPADNPQLVIIVKLDEPQGRYYGGATAAPVIRATLEAALASRHTPLDRSAIARPAVLPESGDFTVASAAWTAGSVPGAAGRRTVHLTGSQLVPPLAPADPALMRVVVPDISGMPMRDGVRRLHTAGFHVRLEGSGRVLRTVPEAGAEQGRSDVVRVIGEVST
jgi:cell division protein FtsI (penicillin-binding protein 3)